MRYLVMVLLIIALIALIITTIGLLRANSWRRIYKTVRKILNQMETEYENYIRTRVNFEVINKEDLDLDIEGLTAEVKTVLQPYLESLWALVNSHTLSPKSAPETKIQAKYFQNLYFLTDKFLKQKLPLTSFEKQDMEIALTDAIKADLSKRLLKLKAGF